MNDLPHGAINFGRYSKEDREKIRQELARIDIDANKITTKPVLILTSFGFDTDGVDLGKEYSIYMCLEMMAAFYLHDQEMRRRLLLVEKNLRVIANAIEQMRKLTSELPITIWGQPHKSNMPLNRHGALAKLVELEPDITNYLNSTVEKVKFPRLARFWLTALTCLYIGVSKDKAAVGRTDGPMVGFLHAASRPVLGKGCPTKEAIRSWLKRDARRDINLLVNSQGGQNESPNDPNLPTYQA